VIVAAWYPPRRAYTVEVIGSVLLDGARAVARSRIAETVGVPVGTVASWLTMARHAASALIRHACTVAAHAVRAQMSPAHRYDTTLAEALDAVGAAAHEFAQMGTPPPARPVSSNSGIDYLGLLAVEHHRSLCRQLHVIASGDALAHARPWSVVNLITARRGLFTAVG
jgi:hypothetical protein